MKTWLLIAVLAVGSIALKTLGPIVAGGRQPPAPLMRLISLLVPALITALVVAGTFTSGRHLVLDARAAGVAAGAVALWFRVPAVAALALAAGVCALVRLAS